MFDQSHEGSGPIERAEGFTVEKARGGERVVAGGEVFVTGSLSPVYDRPS